MHLVFFDNLQLKTKNIRLKMIDLFLMILHIQRILKQIILFMGSFFIESTLQKHINFVFLFSTGKDNTPKDYYTLESIVFLLKNVELQHANYVKKAAVCVFDRNYKRILMYFRFCRRKVFQLLVVQIVKIS